MSPCSGSGNPFNAAGKMCDAPYGQEGNGQLSLIQRPEARLGWRRDM
ncbi:MAG: hypothetical protein ABR545_13420 [Cyclonatronaceae bacterium]